MNVEQAIQNLRQVLRLQHKAWATESAYIYWLRRYINSISNMSPALTSRQKVEFFLTRLACHNDATASTQNQALNGILFFYKDVPDQPIQGVDALRAKRPARVRHAHTCPNSRSAPGCARLGTPKAITAMAHKLARILWHLLKYQEPYDPAVWAKAEEKTAIRKSNASKKTPPLSASNSSQTHELTSLVSYEAAGS